MILANFRFKEHCVCYAKQYLYSPVLHFVSNSERAANIKQNFRVQKISRKIGLRHAMYFGHIYLMILIFQRLQYRKLIVIKYAKKLSKKQGKFLFDYFKSKYLDFKLLFLHKNPRTRKKNWVSGRYTIRHYLVSINLRLRPMK